MARLPPIRARRARLTRSSRSTGRRCSASTPGASFASIPRLAVTGGAPATTWRGHRALSGSHDRGRQQPPQMPARDAGQDRARRTNAAHAFRRRRSGSSRGPCAVPQWSGGASCIRRAGAIRGFAAMVAPEVCGLGRREAPPSGLVPRGDLITAKDQRTHARTPLRPQQFLNFFPLRQ
jgi:hypothetical protein